MNYLDLFSGIGGFALGAYWAGWRFDEHYFSEIESYCIDLYKRRFPDAIALGDICRIETEKLLDNDWFITGGFPCQDISVAGKGEGIEGKRSGLWFEMWRIIRDLRPRWVIAENVGAITVRGLSTVLNSLAQIGYDAEWQDIRASDMGAPHRRERIWIVAYPNNDSRRYLGKQKINTSGIQKETSKCLCKDVAYPNSNGKGKRYNSRTITKNLGQIQPERNKENQENKSTNFDESGQDVAYPKEFRNSSKGNNGNCKSYNQSKRESGRGCLGKKWEANYWTVEPNVGRVAHGISSRVDRLKGLGNSIVPQIAELIFRQIRMCDEQL